MRALTDNFTERLRRALTGCGDAALVILANFEVEDRWAGGELGLPSVSLGASRVLVNRMDEFGLFLGAGIDHVLLKEPPEPAYLDYLDELGLEVPQPLTVGRQVPAQVVTEDVLADPQMLAVLGRLARRGAQLWAHGVSDLEERLSEVTGLPIAGPSAAICKAVNSKIYSRFAADDAGLRQADGMACRSLAEFAEASALAARWLAAGRQVVLKDAFGVSGRGILVIGEQARLDQIHRMLLRRAQRTGRDELAIVVEEWLPKQVDLNYQFTIDRHGGVHFDVVKEAITHRGVHQGHRIPARLHRRHIGEIREAALALGRRLCIDGYFGVVGIDALLTTDGQLYPVIEINARNNMSTYQERLRPAFFDSGYAVLARQYPLRLRSRVPFPLLRRVLDGLLLQPEREAGLLPHTTATINAAVPANVGAGDGGADGRLYGIVIASHEQEAAEIDREVASRLASLSETDGTSPRSGD